MFSKLITGRLERCWSFPGTRKFRKRKWSSQSQNQERPNFGKSNQTNVCSGADLI